MVGEGTRNIMMIIVVSAICIILFAYLFGIVFVNVLKEKLIELRLGTPMGMPKQLSMSSLEGFQSGSKATTSEEESHHRYQYGTSEEESRHHQARVHGTSEEESNVPKLKAKTTLAINLLDEGEPRLISPTSVKSEESTAITPEAIQQRYRDGLAQLKRDMDAAKEREEKSFSTSASGVDSLLPSGDLRSPKKVVQEESKGKRTMEEDNNNDDDKIVISKKFLIENFGGFAQVNPNLKPKTKIDEEYMKLFGGKGPFSSKSGPSPTGFAALEQDDQGRSAWNFDYERNDQVRNLCFRNHTHGKGAKECQYGPTNYADPRPMRLIEKRTFTLNYPPNMTMQDYVNWLYCFANGGEDQLPYNHLKNLEKLKRGIPLVKEEGVCPPSGNLASLVWWSIRISPIRRRQRLLITILSPKIHPIQRMIRGINGNLCVINIVIQTIK